METITLDTPEQRSDRHIEYAGFWRRLVAFVIDVLIIYILQFSIILPLMGVIGFTSVNIFREGPMETTESTTFFFLARTCCLISLMWVSLGYTLL
ncbi:RDD family protein [Fulvivirga maritima]|uniref:RDD family protein n=1 Tax=Fulvivirga maritima TaxID=2904247 RepID=UPI00210303F5|nr:RDD family protein [Fulvivirga maritima]